MRPLVKCTEHLGLSCTTPPLELIAITRFRRIGYKDLPFHHAQQEITCLERSIILSDTKLELSVGMGFAVFWGLFH